MKHSRDIEDLVTEHLLIPVGHCAWSGFFFLYCLVVFGLIFGSGFSIWQFFRRRKKARLQHQQGLLNRSRSSLISVGGGSRKFQID